MVACLVTAIFVSFVRFAGMRQCVKPIISVFFLLMMHHAGRAQHYFFVEAEGGQAFYMKIFDTLYSSTGEGFLIIPKVTDAKVTCTIGFPRGLYPEIQFELNGMDKDRGFLLKHLSGAEWVLLDRQSQEKYEGKGNKNTLLTDSLQANQKTSISTGFASMLSEVTADKTLEKELPAIIKSQAVVKDTVLLTAPSKITLDTTKQIIPPVETERFNPTLNKSKEKRADGKVEIEYQDQFEKGKTDTIKLVIEMPVLMPPANASAEKDTMTVVHPGIMSSDLSCVLPAATTKDIRTIQKKLLGIDIEEDQLAHIEKIYKSRCFTVDQTKEIGWFFRDESVRLKLFKRILPFLHDKSNVLDLGVAFFKEENIRAFKALISQ